MAAHPSETPFVVLHALRLKGFAEPAVVAELTGVDEAAAFDALREHQAAGRVTRREGRISGFALTPAGREEHARRVAEELERAQARPVVEEAYAAFVARNDSFKELCTDWQLKDKDPSCIVRLAELHEDVEPITEQLAGAITRYRPYGPRLGAALERLQAGDLDAFTKPLSGSYHDVWMELHEDLLCTLGKARSAADGH